jgi:hypothetical protein
VPVPDHRAIPLSRPRPILGRIIILSKAIRVLGANVVILVLAVLSGILILDPPPFRLRDEDNFILSVKPPTFDRNLAGSIERGLACKRTLQTEASGAFGWPMITLSDWLKRQSGAVPEPDYHLYGTKPNDTWAIKIDRATNKFCWLRAKDAEAGITDAYCGPSIVREDATRIEALQDGKLGAVIALFFDKTTYTATIASLDWLTAPASAAITYLECH